MPQQQKKKDDRGIVQRIIESPKAKVVAGTTVTTATAGAMTSSALRRKAAVDEAIRIAASKQGLKSPELEKGTGKPLKLTDPVRGQQTVQFAKDIKKPLIKQEINAAIAREADALQRPGLGQRIGRAAQNVRASMGRGTPAPALAGNRIDAVRQAYDRLEPSIDEMRPALKGATTVKDLKGVTSGLQKLGGRSNILGKEISPKLTRIINPIKSGGKLFGKVTGLAALPVSVGVNLLAKKEAEDFATAQQKKQGNTGAPPKPASAAPAPTATGKGYTIDDVANVSQLFNDIADKIENDKNLDVNDNVKRQMVWKEFSTQINANPTYVKAWQNSTHFKQIKQDLGIK